MIKQSTFVALPKRRTRKEKLPDVLQDANRLIDWYMRNRPNVIRLAVSKSQLLAFKDAAGTHGITDCDGVVRYRGFEIYVAKNI